MARTKAQDNAQKPLMWADDSVKPVPKGPPQARGRQQIINDPEARRFGSELLGNLRKAFKMPPVRSNRELIERIDQYFSIVQGRAVPPSVEELALYYGYSVATLNDWKRGRNHGFSDEPEPGCATSAIIKKSLDLVHAYHANMAQAGCKNPIIYIFRAKCYHNMVERQEIEFVQDEPIRRQLTREEIIKNLPDADKYLYGGEGSDYDGQ